MYKFGLIGYPLGHSFSPQIHNLIYELKGIDASYSLKEIKPEELNKDTFENLSMGFAGMNVTIPNKTEIINYLDDVSEEVLKIGAVNTLKNVKNKWIGYNTDVNGFLFPLEKHISRIKTCLVIGTGGAAKAAIYAILKQIIPDVLYVLGRSYEKAEYLKLKYKDTNSKTKVHIENLNKINTYLGKVDLIVNATSLGMYPNINESIYPENIELKNNSIVYDLIYNPLETKLLKQVRANNPKCIAINGLPMLVAQAVKSVEIWTGQSISIENTIKALDISTLSV